MPVKFNSATAGYQTDLTPVIPAGRPGVGSGPDPATANIGSTAGSIFSTFKSVNDQRSLGAYASEAADIVGGTSGYKTERERILSGLSTAEDKGAVQQYYDQLQRLRNGEIQGALPPSSAAARINSLTKSYINRHPALTLKFSQIKNGILDDIPQVSGSSGSEVDPDIEAMNDLIKAAGLKNIAPAEEANFRRSKAIGDAQAETLRAKLQLGEANENDIGLAVQANAHTFYAQLIPEMTKASKDPNFQGMSWYTELVAAKSQIISDTNLMLQQTQQQGNFILKPESRKGIVDEATAPLDQLIEIAKSVDNPKTRQSASDALRRLSENTDMANYRQQLGPIVTLLGGKEALGDYLKEYSRVAKRYEAGQGKSLEAIAKYDFYTRNIIDSLKANGGWGKIVTDAAAAVDSETPRVPTGNPTFDKLNLQAGIDYVVNPGMWKFPKDQEKGMVYLAGDPDAFEAWDNRNDLVRVSRGNTAVLDALHQNSTRLLVEQSHQADRLSAKSIKFDALNLQEPFSIEAVLSAKKDSLGIPGGLYGTNIEFTDPHSRDLVARLNQQYRVFAKMGMSRPEAQKWAVDTLGQLIGSMEGDPNYLEKNATKTPSAEPSTQDTPVIADASEASLAAEAKQAGMSLSDYKRWINQPAQ